jgi:hypothetical protein
MAAGGPQRLAVCDARAHPRLVGLCVHVSASVCRVEAGVTNTLQEDLGAVYARGAPQACMYVCMYVCMYACMHVSMCVCLYVCLCTCVCVSLCVRHLGEGHEQDSATKHQAPLPVDRSVVEDALAYQGDVEGGHQRDEAKKHRAHQGLRDHTSWVLV